MESRAAHTHPKSGQAPPPGLEDRYFKGRKHCDGRLIILLPVKSNDLCHQPKDAKHMLKPQNKNKEIIIMEKLSVTIQVAVILVESPCSDSTAQCITIFNLKISTAFSVVE